jgi:hypothetical protein
MEVQDAVVPHGADRPEVEAAMLAIAPKHLQGFPPLLTLLLDEARSLLRPDAPRPTDPTILAMPMERRLSCASRLHRQKTIDDPPQRHSTKNPSPNAIASAQKL